ncbi:MAG: hypothetical protein WC661_17625 [Opitutaceae bacterium]|jgi:hypothetical protein
MSLKTTSSASLAGAHLRTYQTIFRHPVSHNLGWHDVHSLFRHLGEVEEETNGSFKVTRNGRTLVLNPPRAKDVESADEVIALRHFIEQSETLPPSAPDKDARWLVVIDHHEARIYRSTTAGTVAQQIRSHTGNDFFRHAPDSKAFARGQEKPGPHTYFEPVAGTLNGAGKILVFGTGKGTSNEMDQFVVWLKHHRPAVAGRIVGTEVVDEHHLTDAQLLAKAREFYASPAHDKQQRMV